MSQARQNLLLVAAFAILALGFAGYEWYEMALARAAEHGLRARRTDLDSRFRSAAEELRQAQKQRLAQGTAPAPAAGPAASAPGTAVPRPYQSRMAWMANHPEARTRYLKDFRDMLDTTYGPVFKTLHLPPEQIEKVKDLLTQREEKNLTLAQTAGASGYDPTDPALVAMNNQLTRANNAAIKALVGNEDYQAIHQYLRQTGVVPVVSDLSATMAGLNAPLSADQSVHLTAALAASSQKRPDTAAIPNTVDWDQAMPAAQTILSPEQLSAFNLIQEQNRGLQAINAAQKAAMGAAK